VIPTVIANAFYLPHHLLPKSRTETDAANNAGKPSIEPVPSQAE